MQPLSLSGRVALITGAGRGLGRAYALLFAERGAQVVVNDLGCSVDGEGGDASVAERVVDQIRAAGGQAVTDASDIASLAGGERAVRVALDAFGHIDILVNNAGIVLGGTLEELGEAEIERLIAVHLKGTLATSRAAFPLLKRQRFGRIVNTVSEVALDSRRAGGVGYGAAKASVWGATLAMAREGQPYGITVNAISPGASTRMSSGHTAPGSDLDPVHVARVVGFLVSDAASDVTARVVHAAGGQVREYSVSRTRESELVQRIEREVAP
jgi:NAD(P)-dependent dehydrogenase (short-subunit alcohol dehydrogenase family)